MSTMTLHLGVIYHNIFTLWLGEGIRGLALWMVTYFNSNGARILEL